MAGRGGNLGRQGTEPSNSRASGTGRPGPGSERRGAAAAHPPWALRAVAGGGSPAPPSSPFSNSEAVRHAVPFSPGANVRRRDGRANRRAPLPRVQPIGDDRRWAEAPPGGEGELSQARRRRRRHHHHHHKMAAGSGSAAAVVAVGGSGPAGPQAAGATAAGSGSAGSGAPVPGPGAVLIGDRLYSGVLITLENCLLPEHTLRFTPSMSSGLDPDTETELRVTGCELIQAAGILLRLPQVGLAGPRPSRSGRGGGEGLSPATGEEGRGGAGRLRARASGFPRRGRALFGRSRRSIARPPSSVTGVGKAGEVAPSGRASGRESRGACGLPRPAGSRKRVM